MSHQSIPVVAGEPWCRICSDRYVENDAGPRKVGDQLFYFCDPKAHGRYYSQFRTEPPGGRREAKIQGDLS